MGCPRVPGDAELKTSGMALRKADWLFKGTAVDPREVQLLFVPRHAPYTFTNVIDGRTVINTVVPGYRFIWQVQGVVDTVSQRTDTIVALLDYSTGRILYDVRDDLRPADLIPEATHLVHSPSPRPPRHRRGRHDAALPMRLVATAVYQTPWFKAVVYVLIAIAILARVVDALLQRRDRLPGEAPGQGSGPVGPHALRDDPPPDRGRHPLRRSGRSPFCSSTPSQRWPRRCWPRPRSSPPSSASPLARRSPTSSAAS